MARRRTVTMTLDSASIGKALKEVRSYRMWVQKKSEELTRRLAEVGLNEARVRFSGAMYDGTNDVAVTAKATSNGYVITAAGNAVCFIEFGAGVYYNGAEPYPKPRPAGVSPIGGYGQGKGKQNTWGFYEGGDVVLTHGNHAAMPMYHASRTMQQSVTRIAREVFSH